MISSVCSICSLVCVQHGNLIKKVDIAFPHKAILKVTYQSMAQGQHQISNRKLRK